jgi:hypothetical protein
VVYWSEFLATDPDCSVLIIIGDWYNRPVVTSVIVDLVALYPKDVKKINGTD